MRPLRDQRARDPLTIKRAITKCVEELLACLERKQNKSPESTGSLGTLNTLITIKRTQPTEDNENNDKKAGASIEPKGDLISTSWVKFGPLKGQLLLKANFEPKNERKYFSISALAS